MRSPAAGSAKHLISSNVRTSDGYVCATRLPAGTRQSHPRVRLSLSHPDARAVPQCALAADWKLLDSGRKVQTRRPALSYWPSEASVAFFLTAMALGALGSPLSNPVGSGDVLGHL